MIMCTLLSMVYRLCKPCRLTHVTKDNGLVHFDHSQHVNIVFLLLTLNKCLLAGCKRQVIMFWEHEKRYICFVLKVVSPFSFNNLSLHQTGKSYEQMTNVSALNLLLEPQAYYHCFVPLFNLLYLKKKHFVL